MSSPDAAAAPATPVVSDKIERIVYVPNRLHWLLIGRGGSTARRITAETGVNLVIPNRESKSTIVKMLGTEAQCAKALGEIAEILNYEPSSEPLRTVMIDVPSERYGLLIGRSGSTLKRLQSEFKCYVHIPRRQGLERSKRGRWGEEPEDVVVIGASAQVDDLIAEICSMLRVDSVPIVTDSNNDSAETRDADGDGVADSKQRRPVNLRSRITEVLFFPDTNGDDGWAFDRFIHVLSSATKSVDVCVFNITHDRITTTLQELHAKGVQIRVISDNNTSTDTGSDVGKLAAFGIPVKVDKSEHHMHHKFAVLDGSCLINGSFNWTVSASATNRENVIISTDRKLVNPFVERFAADWADESAFENIDG